jgi:hypothetical protein
MGEKPIGKLSNHQEPKVEKKKRALSCAFSVVEFQNIRTQEKQRTTL